MYEIQSQLQLPGLLQECNEFLINTGVVDIKIFTKKQWKTCINRKISEQNEKEILTMMNSYKKIDAEDYTNESCKIQPYLKALNSKDARLRFKLRAKMTPTVKMNFMSDPIFSENLWTCDGCPEANILDRCRDTQSHILTCEGYSDLRINKDLDSDKGLVDYFDAVLKRRLNL